MKWCEACKCEYEDYAKVCSDCKQTLIHFDESIIDKTTYDYEEFSLLVTCSNNNEANLLLSVLESNDIKAVLKYEGSGSYLNILHGRNFQGVNVFVIASDLNESKGILKEFEYSYTDSPDEYKSSALKKYRRNRKMIGYFIILSFFSNILIVMFFKLFGK